MIYAIFLIPVFAINYWVGVDPINWCQLRFECIHNLFMGYGDKVKWVFENRWNALNLKYRFFN